MPRHILPHDKALALLRIFGGIAFIQHGAAKFLRVPPFPAEGPLPPALVAVAGFEVLAGILLVIGLWARPAAALSAALVGLVFVLSSLHGGLLPAANGAEKEFLFFGLYAYLALAGGGVWSLGGSRRRR